jgi:tetratricopeptide (TPR) repeat protein
MMRRCIPLFVCALTLGAQDNAVKVREDTLTLSTYDEGAPNPDPQFDAFYNNPFPNYPYTIRTPVNKIGRPTPWRVLILENEYLSCRILPDLGGHLHGCTDRITGKEIFYSNPAIRRTAESDRGSFISTGIESSFPIAHSRVSSSPVDFAWSVRDGMGRVVVEDTDRTSGMQWRDEFILRPGSMVLEQRVTLYNASPARRAYHWWANAAVELDDPHLRVVYPVKWMLPHGDGPMTSWPIGANGVDLSDIANDHAPMGLFAHGSREPWMAIYKPKFRSGVAHYANPDQVKGKKIWLWGTDDTYVRSHLTDKFSSYVEMQAGVFETQPEFAFLAPEETKTFSHFWIPFRDLGGVSRVTRDVVLNLSHTGQSVLIELNATHAMPGAKLRLSDGAAIIAEIPADLDPKVKYARTLAPAPARLTLDLINASGIVLLHHVEGEYDSIPFDKTAKNPEPVPPTDKSDSEAAALERGTYNEQLDQWNFAWHDYAAGLRKSPGSVKLRMAAGRAAFVLNRYDDVIRLLADISDPEAAYYYGAALASTTQRIGDAQAALARAAQDSSWAPAARLQSALLAARESGAPGMAEAVRTLQTLAAAPDAPARIGALEVALLRRTSKTDDAKRRLAFWLDRDPANDMLRVEAFLLGNAEDPSLWNHLGADPERLLNVAEQYRQLGAYDDALKLLDHNYSAVPATESEPGTVLPRENPLVVYYRGYCRGKLGQDPKPDFKTASALSTLYVFPHREIYFRILQAAIAQNDKDPVAHALLGDLDFDSLRTAEAVAEWKKALALRNDLPALHRNLGLAEAMNRIDVSAPAAPKPFAPVSAVPVVKGDVESRALVQSPLDPDAAAAQFTAAAFPKEKQPDAVRRAYIEIQLQRLLSRAQAGKCHEAMDGLETLGDEDTSLPFTLFGFGAFMKAAHFQYYLGVVESACGDEKAAKKRWSKISKTSEPAESVDYAFPFLAAKSLGESDARARIDAALRTRPGQEFTRGVLLLAAGKTDEGSALLRQSQQASDPFVQYMSLTALAQASRP